MKATKDNTQFAKNDEISIYAYKGTVPASAYDGAFLKNAGFVFTSDAFGIEAGDSNADNAYWDCAQTRNFYAYHPAAGTTAGTTGYQLTEATSSAAPAVTVKAKAGTGIEKNLLWTRLEGRSYVAVTASGNLDFTHKFSRFSFRIKLETGAPACSLSNVTLTLDTDLATLNLITDGQSAGGSAITLSKDVATTTAVTEADITADGFSPIVPTDASVTGLNHDQQQGHHDQCRRLRHVTGREHDHDDHHHRQEVGHRLHLEDRRMDQRQYRDMIPHHTIRQFPVRFRNARNSRKPLSLSRGGRFLHDRMSRRPRIGRTPRQKQRLMTRNSRTA